MNDRVIATRLANALIPDASPAAPVPGKLAVNANKRAYGGLWVGGRVTLTESAVEFAPNAVNRDANLGTLDVRIPLTEINEVRTQFGMVTRIIVIESPDQTFKVRCFGAKGLAGRISSASQGARN